MMLMVLGLALIALGLLMMLWPDKLASAKCPTSEGRKDEENLKVKGGAVIMIGPVPIVMSSDSRTALILMTLALILSVLWILAMRG
jgi:uncharacterized protein (TIGR00304 family)